MYLSTVHLFQFRNVKNKVFRLSEQLTLIVGENAKGKTNILESIMFLLNGTGFRESKEEELILMSETEGYVEGVFGLDDSIRFKIFLKKHSVGTVKSFFIQKTKKRQSDYLKDQTRAVLFSPEQIEIITGAPEKRRSYFNAVISLFDPEYRVKLHNYESAVRKRNKVLETVHDVFKLHQELKFWNSYLIQQGEYITLKRQEYVDFLNAHPHLDHKQFKIVYEKNEVNELRFAEKIDLEMRTRKTMIGPQKDDFTFYLQDGFDKNIHHYGSRSEQRLSIFWLKMNEIRYMVNVFDKKPVLLLDDVFSEFDAHNKKLIIDLISSYQTVLTTTEEDIVSHINLKKEIIRL